MIATNECVHARSRSQPESTHTPPVPIHLPKTNMFARQLMRAAKATKVRDFTHAACVSRGKERTPLVRPMRERRSRPFPFLTLTSERKFTKSRHG